MVALQVVFLFSLLFLQIVYHKYVLHFELEIKLYIYTIEKILKENTSNISMVCLNGGFRGFIFFFIFKIYFFQIIHQVIIFSQRKTGFSVIEEPLCVVYLVGNWERRRLFAECHWIKP